MFHGAPDLPSQGSNGWGRRQEHYDETVITQARGSDGSALKPQRRTAGWRKARR